MKDASDFDYHLELTETRNSFLYDSSELFKKRSLWLRRFVLCQTNPQMEYQMFTTGNSWLEEWWSRKEDTTISPRKVFLLTFSFPKVLSLFPGKENSSFRLRPSDKGKISFWETFQNNFVLELPPINLRFKSTIFSFVMANPLPFKYWMVSRLSNDLEVSRSSTKRPISLATTWITRFGKYVSKQLESCTCTRRKQS